jgi:acetyltransferase-like isoleucine patch superfamily enzyme
MINQIKGVWRSFSDRIYASRNPSGFVKSLGVRLGNNVRFYGVSRGMFGSEPWMISIGNNCYITAGVQFINHDGGTLILRQFEPSLEWTAPISIGNDVYIGVQSIILPNVNIGNKCIIGAGSVVSRDVPDNSVYAGVPARFICTTDDYFQKLKNKSLGCGHLHGEEKAQAIREIYQKKGWFDTN